jgi:carbon-monoxide dehydrogenase medium subunit
MYQFSYHSPSSVADAAAAVTGAEDGKIVAGGQTLLATMKQRLAAPSDLISLRKIRDLVGISVDGSTVTIGAMTTHAAVAASNEVRRAIPGLADLAGGIGDPQVRNRGTIGGSVANNDPAADYPAAVLGLGATVVTTKREIAAEDFFTGMFETALEEDEIITSIRFPVPKAAAYAKFDNPASRYALVGVFIAKTDGGTRVAVTGAGQDGVFRATDIESQIDGGQDPDSGSIDEAALNGDIHASPAYRKHLIGVMARRALAAMG